MADRTRKHTPTRNVFVIMPIRKEGTDDYKRFQAIYENFIKRPLLDNGYTVFRADEESLPGVINTDIVKKLLSDALVIADLTDHNPNVFYELGIRHAFHQSHTILTIDRSRSLSELPFDISGSRVIGYYGDLADVKQQKEFHEKLMEAVSVLVLNKGEVDNPVHSLFSDAVTKRGKSASALKGATRKQLDQSGDDHTDPQQVIRDALLEVDEGLLPRAIIQEAHDSLLEMRRADYHSIPANIMRQFIECVDRFMEIKALLPTESEIIDFYYLCQRIQATNISRALLEFGLKIFPESSSLTSRKIHLLAHSSQKADREAAIKLIHRVLRVENIFSEEGLEAVKMLGEHVDLLSILLDVLHRDGKHEECLLLASKLKDEFPENSVALRNYARALEKTSRSGGGSEEVLKAYAAAIHCRTVDDTSALWYSSHLEKIGRLRDAIEVAALACRIDLEESITYAHLARLHSEVLEPRNALRSTIPNMRMPKEACERVAMQCIIIAHCCENFGVEQKLVCERAIKNIGVEVEALQELADEMGEVPRAQRRSIIVELHETWKTDFTLNVRCD